jgi:flavodoxin
MNALVVYDSQFGNTEQLARAIARALGAAAQTRVATADAVEAEAIAGADLVVMGGPTQRRGLSPPVQALLDRIPPGALRGLSVAVFDTRYRMLRWVSGSAARVLAKRLRAGGATLLAPPASFFVERRQGPLEPGQVERATAWGAALYQRWTGQYPQRVHAATRNMAAASRM